jgi:fatty-acyl-CoA synthase
MTTHAGPPLADAPGIGALTLGGVLDEAVGLFGPNEALVLDDELRGGATVRWTYDDLHRESRLVAGGLIAAGVEPGQPVGILMGNRPEAVAALFGIALAGGVAVLLSTVATPTEGERARALAEVDVVLTQTRLRGRDLPKVPGVLASVGGESWDALRERGASLEPTTIDERSAGVGPEDPALVIFSSGTTSGAKGVLHAHRSPSLQCWMQARVFGRHPRTRLFSALPMFWTAGLNTALGATLAAGGCWVMQETFHATDALSLMARERVTEPYTLPHQTATLAELDAWETTDLSSLRSVFGKGAYARHPSVDGDRTWQMPVGYGMTETCSIVAVHDSTAGREQARHGLGRLLPGARLRVTDVGELAVAGPTLMLGYLGRDPADCFDEDGFFHTGDHGHVDRHGIVHYEGRAGDLIKSRGVSVSPAELEVELRACPPVKLGRVVGVGDDSFDQLVVACVVPKDGATPDAEEIRSFLRSRVAAYKVPQRVLFFDAEEMPMTASDTKVRDDRLRELVQARLQGER